MARHNATAMETIPQLASNKLACGSHVTGHAKCKNKLVTYESEEGRLMEVALLEDDGFVRRHSTMRRILQARRSATVALLGNARYLSRFVNLMQRTSNRSWALLRGRHLQQAIRSCSHHKRVRTVTTGKKRFCFTTRSSYKANSLCSNKNTR